MLLRTLLPMSRCLRGPVISAAQSAAFPPCAASAVRKPTARRASVHLKSAGRNGAGGGGWAAGASLPSSTLPDSYARGTCNHEANVFLARLNMTQIPAVLKIDIEIGISQRCKRLQEVLMLMWQSIAAASMPQFPSCLTWNSGVASRTATIESKARGCPSTPNRLLRVASASCSSIRLYLYLSCQRYPAQ